MKKIRNYKYFMLLITSILFISISYKIPFALNSIDENSEQNWYFVGKGKDNLPEPPKETIDIITELDGYFLGETDEKVIYLTFDQGYENGYTEKILDILEEKEVPAAFFVVKPYIDTNPELIMRMANEGHLVCNHSSTHPSMATVTNDEAFEKELLDVEKSYTDLTGLDMPKFFRPPMGKYSPASLSRTKNLGYKTIFWSFAYKDWIVNDQPSKRTGIKKITKGVHPGCIMLLHSVSKTNLEILETVIDEIREDGYEFKSLEDL